VLAPGRAAARERGVGGRGTELFASGEAGGASNSSAGADAPPGCCSWDLEKCGQVHGKCVGGVKQCELCKGQWIKLPQSLCEKGHSLEKPLPRIWNFTSHAQKPTTVKVMSYNLYWWYLFDKKHNDHTAGQLIKESAKDEPYDVIGFQECNEPYRVLWDAGLDSDYKAHHTYQNICIAWRKKAWEELSHGWAVVAQDASWAPKGQNYGQRHAMWVRLRHRETKQTLFFLNHHGPLPLSSGGDWGGPETARKLLNLVAHNATEGDAVVMVGDFNSKLHSLTVEQVGCRLHKVLSGTKFGGVDHIFANVDGSQVASSKLLGRGGSDHNALNAVLKLGPKEDSLHV